MDENQTAVDNSPLVASPKELSIRSQNGPELTASPVASIQNKEPITPIQSPKQQSPVSGSIKASPQATSPSSPTKSSLQLSIKSHVSSKSQSVRPGQEERKSIRSTDLSREIIDRSPRKSAQTSELSKNISLNGEENVKKRSKDPAIVQEKSNDPVLHRNIDKITSMSITLTNEANALRDSIRSLTENIVRTKEELNIVQEEDVNFPYHLFLIEIIINKIHMKCDCFELDYNNLVIAATFLGKQPIILYDSSYGKIDDFTNLNVGKSALFAMTYDRICTIKDFIININITKQPPCSSCVSKIAETKVDYSKEFMELREELCKKWTKDQPNDNIICTTSTPLKRRMFYLSCGDTAHSDSIGIIELTTRMSFLGKEITTAFSACSKPKCTSVLTKEDNGMSIYACHNVEMDGQGKIILDENTLNKKEFPRSTCTMSPRSFESPMSQLSSRQGSAKQYMNYNNIVQKYQQGVVNILLNFIVIIIQ